MVRRTMVRYGLRNWQTGAAWDKRLSFWVQVAVEAARNRMLTLWVCGICSIRQLAERIWNRTLWAANDWCSRLLICGLIYILLLPLLGRKGRRLDR
jgi:hypothetical protein